MKKYGLLLAMLFFTCGCTNIANKNITELASNVLAKDINLTNQFRDGYKYYLPRDLALIDKSDYNEIIKSANYNYYLYIDVISFVNDTNNNYDINLDAYYSAEIKSDKHYGYIEINEYQNKYHLEMMYNYAKIEVIVAKTDIKETVMNAMLILSSIEYNKDILVNLVGDNVLNFTEIQFDMFKAKEQENNLLKVEEYEEEYGTYKGDIPDTDLIK